MERGKTRAEYAEFIITAISHLMRNPATYYNEVSFLPTYPRFRNQILSTITEQTGLYCTGSQAKTIGDLADELARKAAPKTFSAGA